MTQTGTVQQILPIESGESKAGKAWSKQTFVIGFKDGSYDKILAISTMKPELLTNIAVGQNVTVELNVSSREYNGKFYTDATAWKITASEAESPVPLPLDQQGDGLPF